MQQILNLQTGNHEVKRIYKTVYLENLGDDTMHMFYCDGCRCSVMQYAGEAILVLPGLAKRKVPVIIKCRNDKCNRFYQFVSIVSESLG